jgi:predicted PurR-regulated permease PerM
MLRPFVDVIAWSIVLVIAFYPVHQHLATRTGRPSLSALLSCLVVVLTILIPVAVVCALVVSEVLSLRESLLSNFHDGFDPNAIEPVRAVISWVSRFVGLDLTKSGAWISQHASELAQMAARYSVTLAGNLSSLIVSFCFTAFTMFFLFRDGEQMARKIPDCLPLERSESEALIRRIRDVIDGSIYGVLVIAVIQGGLGALMFWLLTIPSPVIWGLVMAVASLFPCLVRQVCGSPEQDTSCSRAIGEKRQSLARSARW